MMKQPNVISNRIQVQAVGQHHGFLAYLAPAGGYPVPETDRDRYLSIYAQLIGALDELHGTAQETLLQMWKLHHDGASKQLSKHGADWIPIIGTGVWLHKSPPSLWTVEEFESFVPGEVPRPPILMLFRLKGQRKQLANVLPLLGGRGVLIQAGIQGDPDQFYRICEDYFRTFITEPLHLAYPFFFPLIDGGALPAIPPDLVDRVLGRVQYYIRESAEDGGIIILSQSPLDPVFDDLGWQLERRPQP